MKQIYSVMIVGLLCGLAVSARADVWTALQTVAADNPEIAAARARLEQTQSDLGLAQTGWQPTVAATGGIARAKTKADGMNLDRAYTQKEYGIGLTQNVFQGGTTLAATRAADWRVQAEQARVYATQQDVFLATVQAYIDVLNTREVLKLEQNNERVLQGYYDRCEEKAKVGVLTQTDVAQARARLAGARYRVIDAGARAENALETYRRLVGEAATSYPDIDLTRTDNLFPKTLSGAEETALKTHPALVAVQAQYAAADENITVARQTYMPSVDVKASAVKYHDIPVVDEITDGRIGVYLTVPLYDKGVTRAQTRKAKATRSEVQMMMIQTRRTILEHLRQAWNRYQAQKSAIEAADLRVRAARLALSGVRDEQEQGRRTVLDVLNAERELLDARVMRTQAGHARVAAYFAVLSGMGRLTPEALSLSSDKANGDKR